MWFKCAKRPNIPDEYKCGERNSGLTREGAILWTCARVARLPFPASRSTKLAVREKHFVYPIACSPQGIKSKEGDSYHARTAVKLEVNEGCKEAVYS